MIKETFDGLPLIAGVKTGSENSLLGLFSAIWSMDSCSNPSRSQSLSNSLSKKRELIGLSVVVLQRIHNSAADIFQCCNKRLNLIGSDLFFNHGSYIGFKFVRYKKRIIKLSDIVINLFTELLHTSSN